MEVVREIRDLGGVHPKLFARSGKAKESKRVKIELAKQG